MGSDKNLPFCPMMKTMKSLDAPCTWILGDRDDLKLEE